MYEQKDALVFKQTNKHVTENFETGNLDTRRRTKTNGKIKELHKNQNTKDKKKCSERETPPKHLGVQQPLCSIYRMLVG
jgi:hypothetical protein